MTEYNEINYTFFTETLDEELVDQKYAGKIRPKRKIKSIGNILKRKKKNINSTTFRILSRMV